MTNQHPITPSPELVKQWREAPEFSALSPCVMVTVTTTKLQDIATQAARWGADQELEACRMEIIDGAGLFYIDETSDRVRLAEDIWTARRPNLPSLKEQALKELAWVDEHLDMPLHNHCNAIHAIRRALEQLPDNE
jgi:hypothetical protein